MTNCEISFTPIIEIVNKLQERDIYKLGLDPEANEMLYSIMHYAEDQEIKLKRFLATYDDLLKQIRTLKTENKSQQEKCDILWDSLEKALDTQFKEMTQLDQELYMGKAREAYFESWTHLSESSRIMLATALSIHDALRGISDKDLSPVIIEYCRIFENEFRLKLYDGFIPLIDPYKSMDVKEPYICFIKAAEKYKENGQYFLSLAQMILCVQELKNNNKRCSLSDALSVYLIKNQWNKNKLTDKTFTSESLTYTNQYRNKSAHPNIMSENDVTSCVQKTKRLVGHFISCMPSQ